MASDRESGYGRRRDNAGVGVEVVVIMVGLDRVQPPMENIGVNADYQPQRTDD
jgi:hypothetical protein